LTALEPVSDPANWRAADIADGSGWLYTLTSAEVEDLQTMAERALDQVGGDSACLLQLSRKDVDPGCFSSTLHTVRASLQSGLGFALLRGLPQASMQPSVLAAIYWGIGLHLGIAQPNNPQGDMLGHVTDLGKTQSDPKSRGYQTREAMDYHCDQCDIVGLYCVRPAKAGGLSKLASSVAMYNTLLAREPEMAAALAEPLYWTKHGEHADSELPYYTSPVFNFNGGRLSTSFGPKHIFKGHDLPDTPALTSLQRTAITTAEDIAEELHLSMELQAGDMQFVNNYTILHTRTAYEDYPDPSRRRLLWRLWLMTDGLRDRTDYARQWEKGVKAGRAEPRLVI
jgi:hypothetical protein